MAEKKNLRNKSEEEKLREKTPLLEWIVAAIGLVIVVGSVGFLLFSALTRTDQPPILIVKEESVTNTEGGFLVKFSLENKSQNNAGAVMVEGKLLEGEKEIETSSASVSYAPSNSKREGGMIFTKNPESYKLELRAIGYEKP